MPLTLTEAMQQISQNSNLTTQQIIDIALNTSVSAGDAEIKLLYSGRDETMFTIAGKIYVNNMVYNNQTGTWDARVSIANTTDAFKFIETDEFKDAFENSLPEGVDADQELDRLIYGKINDQHVDFNSVVDKLSAEYARRGPQPTITLFDDPFDDSYWSTSEAYPNLHGETPSIDGVSTSTLQSIFNDVKIAHGEAAAMDHIKNIMVINSYNNMADNLFISETRFGEISNAATKADFFKIPGFIDSITPANSYGFSKVKDILSDINQSRLDNLKALAEFAKDHPQLMDNLKHIGFASVAVSTVMLITDVNDALAAGDEAHASQLVEDYFAGMAGEFVGGVIGLEGALFLTRLVLASTPQGLALAAIAFVGSYIGGNYGEEAGKFLYHLFEELTEKFESISQMLLDAAKEFAKCYISPIVFDLDGDGIELTHVDNGVNFDLDNNGIAEQTGWLGKDDGFLVKDLNNNGKIDNQSEMFGTDNTSTALQKLIALDTNGNGKVEGTELSALRIWKDLNQDGVTQAGELQTLTAAGIGSIPTSPSTNVDYKVNGNILDWQATWLKADGSAGGKFGDVFFQTNQLNGWYVGAGLTTPTINPEALLLPLSRSYGALKPLHLAASEDAGVMQSLHELSELSLVQLDQADTKMANLLYHWAGMTTTAPESGSIYYNARNLGVLEQFFNHDFKVTGGTGANQNHAPHTAANDNSIVQNTLFNAA